MRVIVCGSRDWTGVLAEERIYRTLTAVETFSQAIGSDLVIIHGGCPTGADAIADRWVRRRDDEPEIWLADWTKYGKGAGPVRNIQMAMAGADMCLAFLREHSRGTQDMIVKAEVQKIPTFVIHWEEC